MAGDIGTTEQLDALVSGKRRSARHAVCYPVRIKGVAREFDALAQDLSEGGVLLEMSEAELAGHDEASLGPAGQFHLVETHFRDSFDVHFRERGVVAEATLVRMSVRPEWPNRLFLGCQFVQPLGDVQQRRLGLLHDHPQVAPWDEVEALRDLPWERDGSRPLFMLLFDAAEAVAGPRYMGPAVAAGIGALVMRIDGASVPAVIETMAGRTLHLQLMRGPRVVYAGPVRLLASRFVDGPSSAAHAAVGLEGALPRRVRRLFKRRR